MSLENKYIYCSILLSNFINPLSYLGTEKINPGDYVLVPLRDEKRVGLVLDVKEYEKDAVPYPLEYTRPIIRKVKTLEEAFSKDFEKLEPKRAKLFKTDSQKEKETVKNILEKTGVDRDKITGSKNRMYNLLKDIPDQTEVLREIEDSIYGGLVLSDDKKRVTGIRAKKRGFDGAIKIPAGVEVIEDYAFNRIKITSLYLPKELKELGAHTISGDRENDIKCITSIEIEDGNECYETDENALYKKMDGKRELVYVFHHDITEFTVPKDVVSIGNGAFYHCSAMKKIQLPEGLETFDENCIAPHSEIKEIFLPKTIRHLIKRVTANGYGDFTSIKFHVDEECENVFSDEDSIYEVLEDGTYKLIMNRYMGKGKALILDNTSIIGREAFSKHKNLTTLTLPKSVKIIEKYAFEHSELKEIEIPKGVQRIEEGAFCMCPALKKAYIPSSVLYVSEEAFDGCYKLDEIKSDIKDEFSVSTFGKFTRKVPEQKEATSAYGDFFEEYVVKMKRAVDAAARGDEHIADRVIVDKENKVITLQIAISQASKNRALVKERIDAAETISAGEEINIVPCVGRWDVKLKDGKSIGEVGLRISEESSRYMNRIQPINAQITGVVPKSKRRASAKYASVFVKFDIVERKLPNETSKEEKLAVSQFAYGVDGGEIKLSKWIGDPKTKKVVIPAMIEGKPVVSVPYGLFEHAIFDSNSAVSGPEEIVISEGIKRIEAYALSYYSFSNLRLLSFPASLEFIHKKVFTDPDMEAEVGMRDSVLDERQIFVAPKGSYAEDFLINYKPASELVKYLTVIDDDSETIKVVRGLEIEQNKNYVIATFHGGDLEKEVVLPFEISGKPVKTLDLYYIPKLVKKLVIPDTVTKILSIASPLFNYGAGNSLERIEISDENKSYWSDGYSIFTKDRKTLLRFMSYVSETYTVPEGTKKIASYAFRCMKNLTGLTLPKSIVKIENDAFTECENLKDIKGLEYASKVGDQIFGIWASAAIPFAKLTPIVIAGSTLVRCNDYSEKIIKIPDGVTAIGNNAFGYGSEDDNVEEFILPKSVKEIGSNAFGGRLKLRKINIPGGVTSIKSSTFRDCESLEELTIPASVSDISTGAFPRHGVLKKVIVDPDNKTYSCENGMLFTKDKKELLFIPNCVDESGITVLTGVEKINASAAYENNTLKELVLPEGVTTIGENAFAGCANLTKVVLPKSVTHIEKSAFSKCVNLEEVVLSDSLETISEAVFSDCVKLSKVVWPKDLKRIEDRAFFNTGLIDVALPEGVAYLGVEAFAGILSKKVTVPKSVRTLGWGVFSGTEEIEVYDTITPDAKDCLSGINTDCGYPNSLVGFIGIGPAEAKWEYTANHKWMEYTITVKSAKTDEIKYKVWMGADKTQRPYYCFLTSAWGKNATFAFKSLDAFFEKIRGAKHKKQVAAYRLAYPVDMSDEYKKIYEEYLNKKRK